MSTFSPARLINPFLLWGGLFFTLMRRAVTAGVVLLFIHLFIITVVPVRGDSMAPTLANHSLILVDQLTHRFRPLRRGEIIAFRYPLDPKQKFIKRVVGVAGDTIIIEGGQVSLRDQEGKQRRLLEPYLPPHLVTTKDRVEVIDTGELFVLGDDRPLSSDSRDFGAVPQKNVLGRAVLTVWPPNVVGFISHIAPFVLD